MKTTSRSKKRMKKLQGNLRQKSQGGNYYYRLTIANGVRKEFALKTSDETEAIQRAEELDSIYTAPNLEVAAAQISAIKGFSKQALRLPLSEGYAKYEVHPDRATPHTVSEQLSYKTTYEDFVAFVTAPGKHTVITSVAELNNDVAEEYAAHMRTFPQAVDTHNRKIKRLRKIFDCLKDYYSGDNPFRSKTLLRNPREEQDTVVRRQAFTKEQEQQLRDVLIDDKFKVINKPEIRVIYYIGMYTGQCLKDCVLLQWQNIDMERQRIWVKQFKTGKEVTIPMAKELFKVFQEAAAWKENQYVCPKSAERYNRTDSRGKNIGNNLINIDVLRVVKWIGLEPSISVPGRTKKMTVYGFHSLRHSFASFCAEAGVPKAVLLSILGTDSDIADKYYTHVGDAAQREAINAIYGASSHDTLRERIQKVLDLLDSKPEPTQELLDQIKNILK
jgi:integrase